ncbi:nucleoside hydrolase [Pseudomonas sp. NPDC086278]|uniref:nucleoside hydrolase n=1 Tax=Pseudomonas sp. NPDC086278 TaxID=3390646 RepID=UPI003D00E976
MAKEKIIIDCDPGVDDAVAILLAFASPDDIEVMGITTVAGNVSLEFTTKNALKICQLAGKASFPVYAGCQHAMFPTPPTTSSVHGDDGLGDVELEEVTSSKQSQHAVDFIIETVRRFPGEITLCPIGPMTNIAMALLKEPDIASKIKKIVFMGGAAFCPGNTTPAAEFNIWFDPHAAQIVLTSGVPLVMLGLDVTNKAIMTADRINVLRGSESNIGTKAAAMMTSYGAFDPCLHDPCAIAYVLDPSIFAGVLAKVDVECESLFNRGRTTAAIQERHRPGAGTTCQVITDVDDERLFGLLSNRLLQL